MVRLRRAVPGFAGEVYAKLEYLNPMGSIKDRIARHMVEQALADGRLRAGRHGGRGLLGQHRDGPRHDGDRAGPALRDGGPPADQPREDRRARARSASSWCWSTATCRPSTPRATTGRRGGSPAEIPGAFFPDQHNDRANNEAHYRTTGPEIWRQMEGRIDWFVAGIGTGGTVSGVARYLKEQDPRVKVLAVDIAGSVFTDWFRSRPPR